MSNENEIYSINFGKKERVLNYACQTYQLSRPNKVGTVMALIRECQPDSLKEWKEWYFANAFADDKNKSKITNETLKDLGIRLYEKITETVIPEWTQAFKSITQQDCIDYIYNLTINRTYDGYLREKSVIYDGLAKIFSNIIFEESDPKLDHAGDIDYIVRIGKYAIGFQIKPITAKTNFASYSLSERMKSSFNDFTQQFSGKVFIIFSINKEIANTEIIEEIRKEMNRLQSIQ